jgi:transposase
VSCVRHPAKHQAVAQRLHGQGLSAREIARRMANAGAPVDNTTVLMWVSPEFRERRLVQMRRVNAKARAKRAKRERKQALVQRSVQLRRAGLSCSAVAIVLNLDHGTTYAPATIRNWTRDYGPFTRSTGTISKDTAGNWGGS